MKKSHRDHFVEFDEHTRLKHAILQRYLKAWVEKLLNWRDRRYQRIWFVDAFAGPGQDQRGNPGSPLIAARIAKGVHNKHGGETPPLQILAIERDAKHFEQLQETLEEQFLIKAGVIHPREGTLSRYLEKFERHVEDEPVLFFLDPFGVDGLEAGQLEVMLRGPHNEVFALFSDTGASRLLAVLAAEERDTDEEVRKVLQTPSLFAEMDEMRVERILDEAERSNKALLDTKASADRILSEALGEERKIQLLRVSARQRQDQAVRLWRTALTDAGATHTVALPIMTAEGTRLHQLVYASKSATGLTTMKESMSTSLRHASLPADVVTSIAFEVRTNPQELMSTIVGEFGGHELRWTGDHGLKEWLLINTDVLQFHLSELKDAMDDAGWLVSKRPIVVQVPMGIGSS